MRNSLKISVILSVVICTPAVADNLKKVMSKPAASTYQGSSTVSETERCIVSGPMPDAPTSYHTPDHPNQSIIYYPRFFMHGQSVVALSAEEGRTTAKIWNPIGRLNHLIEECLATNK